MIFFLASIAFLTTFAASLTPNVKKLVPQTPSFLNNFTLTYDELIRLSSGQLSRKNSQILEELQKKEPLSYHDKYTLTRALKRAPLIAQAEKRAGWHWKTPSIGIIVEQEPAYPFVPHYFSLWDLAPKRGAGIKIATIDTGLSAFSFQNDPSYLKHRNLFMSVNNRCSYNVSMPTDTTPLKKIYEEVCRFAHAPPSWLMSEKIIIGGIISYLESGSSDSFDSMLAYLHVSGNDSARSAKEVIKKIIREFPDFFIIEHLIVQHTHTTLPVLKQLLPLSAPAITSQEALCAAHGNHIFGLIGARLSEQNTVTKNTFDRIRDFDDGVVGIAPEADIVMLKAFHDQSFESDKKTITEALKRARLLAIDIVNMSLKVADTLDRDSDSTKEFEESIAQIPYIVAASGNDGSPRAPGYCGKKIGYPARFPSVDFTVGAFGCTDEGIAYIPDFSQYEPGIGPHYLCPGVEILSAGMQPRQDVDSSYIFLDGTSMATPIMTGFIALMLSEFKDNFSRQQISDVTKAATVRLENEPAWKTKVVYGVIDMRTALLMLHVLNEIKKRIPEKLFADNFIPFLQALKVLLFWPAEQYGQTFLNGSSFSTAMLAYIRQAEALSLENKQKVALRAVEDCFFNNADDYTLLNEHKLPSQNTFFRPSFKMIAHDSKTILQQVISYYADILTEVFAQSSIHTKVHNPPSPILQPFVTQELRDKIQAFFPSF